MSDIFQLVVGLSHAVAGEGVVEAAVAAVMRRAVSHFQGFVKSMQSMLMRLKQNETYRWRTLGLLLRRSEALLLQDHELSQPTKFWECGEQRSVFSDSEGYIKCILEELAARFLRE